MPTPHLARFAPSAMALATASLIAGCLGGGGDSTPPVVAPTTTNVTTTVIDGALRNALVCVDKNRNSACEASETQGRTDATGNVTLPVPNADVGQYPLVAVVGTDAVDADNGPVTVPFTLSAPAGQAAVVSPLTTQVVNAMASGATLAAAEASVKSSTNINVGLFQDYTTVAAKAAAAAAGGSSPADVARLIVVTTQAQSTALAPALNTPATGGANITQADLDKAVQQRILQLLPEIVAAVTANPGLTGATLATAVVAAVTPSLTTPAQAPTVVAINNQQVLEAAQPAPAYVAAASIQIDALNFTDANNWSSRVFSNSLAQATLDANGNLRVNDRRNRANNGVVANWNFGNNPQDQSNLHWTGSAWEPCGLNFEFTATVRDANGNNSSNYCNNYSTTASSRTGFDISGQTMAAVYDQIRTGGFTNLTIANAATMLGAQTFPADSKLFYQTSTRLTAAPVYGPGSNSLVFNYSAAVSAGGDSRVQAAGTGCNSVEFQPGPAIATTTLENLVAAYRGNPCLYNQSSFQSGGTTFYDGGTQNSNHTSSAWGNSTLSIGTVGSVNIASTPTAFFTGNRLIRLAFTGTGSNPVTYYSCSQRFINGSARNCTAIGSGSWVITTLADGSRTMTFTNPPATSLTFNRVLVERNSRVNFGFQDKLTVTSSARFNTQASIALFAKLGMPAIDPEVPLALTAASYQGTWDLREAGTPFAFNVGTRVVISGTNAVTCFDNGNGAASTCTGAITNPLTGAFSGTSGNGGTNSGIFSFITGTATGTYNDPNDTPPASGAFVGARR